MSYKSYNDIMRQRDRVLLMAEDSGMQSLKTIEGKPSVSIVAAIASRTLAQHGIGLFCSDRDKKKPLIHTVEHTNKPHTVIKTVKPPVPVAKARVPHKKGGSTICWRQYQALSSEDKIRYERYINEGANHEMKMKVLSWINQDVALKVYGLYDGDPLEIPKWLVELGNDIISSKNNEDI